LSLRGMRKLHIKLPRELQRSQIEIERDSIDLNIGTPMLVKIEVYNDGESWCARGIGEDIFTQGQTLDELYANIKEADSVHFGDEEPSEK